MTNVSRRQLLQFAALTPVLATAACAVDTTTQSQPGVLAKNVPTSPLKSSEVTSRLLTLRSRGTGLDPTNPSLISALNSIPNPVLVYDLAQVEENYLSFIEADPEVDVHYAVKSCPNPAVMQTVANAGGGFDFASRAELDLALETGVAANKCVFSNTAKFPEDIAYAASRGVEAFLTDSVAETHKNAQHAPGSKLYVRLVVNATDAAHPLGRKFGVTPPKAVELLKLGQSLGLAPYGTHFHVGTQAYSANAWVTPTQDAAWVWQEMRKSGVQLTLFDIGGGYPAPFLGRPIPTVKNILDTVRATLRKNLPDETVVLAAEPGRGICGTAGLFSSRVLLRSEKEDGDWITFDIGLYQGLGDAVDHLIYPMSVPGRHGPQATFTSCGPTCDSVDTFTDKQSLPSDITLGDLVLISVGGAYSECLFTNFNGIHPPQIKYLHELVGG